MDYLKFYELRAEPFRNDPNLAFFFESRAQIAARLRIMRGVAQRRGLCVLVGSPGHGKTMLARHLLASLEGPERCVRMLGIPHRDCDTGWLLPRISNAFGVTQPAPTSLGALSQIYERLSGLGAAGRHPVLLVDEAQLLANPRVMEEFRGLLNLEDSDRKLLSLVLFGLPDLDDVLRLDTPLAQRVDIRVTLEGLGEDEVSRYVEHRLKRAGAMRNLFTPEAIDALYAWTGGVPRIVNTLADNALFEGALAQARMVDAELLVAAAEQLGLVNPNGRPDIARAEPEPTRVHELARPVAPFAAPPVAPPRVAPPVVPVRAPRPAPVADPAPATVVAPLAAEPMTRPMLTRPTPPPPPEPITLPTIDEEVAIELEPDLTPPVEAPAFMTRAVDEREDATLEPGDAEIELEESEPISLAQPVSFAVPAPAPASPARAQGTAAAAVAAAEEELADGTFGETTQESLVDLLSELEADDETTLTPPRAAAQAAPARPEPKAPAAKAPVPPPKDDDENVDLDALFEEIQTR